MAHLTDAERIMRMLTSETLRPYAIGRATEHGGGERFWLRFPGDGQTTFRYRFASRELAEMDRAVFGDG